MPLKIILFSRERFPSANKAKTLLEIFGKLGGILAPTRYGEHEPPRSRFDASNLTEPANMLSGYEKVPSGWIYLRGIDNDTVSWIRWSEGTQVMPWYMYISDKALKTAAAFEDIEQLLGGLAAHFDVVFGGAGSEEYWDSCCNKMDSSIEVQPLPGIFPLTVFGKELVEYFGRRKLTSLENDRIFEWNESIGLLASHNLMIDYDVLRDRVNGIRNALGEDLFFDIDEPQREFRSVVECIPEKDTQSSEDWSNKKSFTYMDVRTPEGEEIHSPSEMVGVLTTYLYDVVPEVAEYTRDSLNALDAYFAKHPPRSEFNQAFLLSEFIPVLGAHLGETLVRSLGGIWVVRSPLLHSSIDIDGNTAKVFELAYEVVFEGKKFVEIYDFYLTQ